MEPDGERLQFCRDGFDISGDPYCEDDATEVRVWCSEGALVSVTVNDTGTWEYAGSDYGANQDWEIDRKYPGWQEALEAFGYGKLVP
ncbi:hypothetical protein [Mycobacteroides abscessus]|uniref:hypothetical protein n=1 Tax=Mycobacteroides abscessus TaxID=36809 RepID=UPI000C25AC1F|nr:hypothetical protein [Mycobacteroides abscessus]